MNPRRQQLVEAYYSNKMSGIEIVVDNFANPHDIAAIARSADGFGVSTIHLHYTYLPYPDMSRLGKKSSASANKWMRYENVDNFVDLRSLKKGYSIVGLMQNETASPLHQYSFSDKTILVVPSPEQGLSPEIECDDYISLPASKPANYSTSNAVAVLLYEIFTQHGRHLAPLSSLVERGKRD